MAIVLDEFTATLTRTVFIKPPDGARLRTSIPRALVNFTTVDTVSAKPVNDQQELAFSISLDSQFAYRLVDFNVHLTQDVANSWTNRAYLEIFNGVRNLPTASNQRHPVTLEMGIRINAPTQLWMGRFEPGARPQYVLQVGPAGGAPVLTFEATNQAAPAGAAGGFSAHITFYEYEIEQAEYVNMHFSPLVYDR